MAMNALVVLSGGQDSTTCLYWAKQNFSDVHALTINYGQRHIRELEAAATIAGMAGVKSHEILAIGNILLSTSPLVNFNEQVEKYKDAASLPGGLEKTFVPMRNTLFLTIAANRAVAHGCNVIVTGVSQEDYGGYPDCRAVFIQSMEMTINMSLRADDNDPYFTIVTPLINRTKRATVEMAMGLEGCMEALAFSHTCYEGEYPPCGKCHACLLRDKGFAEAGVPDPLVERLIKEGVWQ